MVGKKWYVVIVGKAVGVFASWWVVPSVTELSCAHLLTHVPSLNNAGLKLHPWLSVCQERSTKASPHRKRLFRPLEMKS